MKLRKAEFFADLLQHPDEDVEAFTPNQIIALSECFDVLAKKYQITCDDRADYAFAEACRVLSNELQLPEVANKLWEHRPVTQNPEFGSFGGVTGNDFWVNRADAKT